ncbi:hypothetical protein PINS_up010655 [Pythium insidiosum]|nr:hypothetical protein PINS_up010655 [Pythium insidiosum]
MSSPFDRSALQATRNAPYTDDKSSAKRIVTQQWTLHSDSTATSSAIHSVTVDLPGLTVVQTSNNTTTNTTNNGASHHNLGVVEVAADSPELLSCVDVEPLPPTELQLRFRREDTACREIQGRLLTSLMLSRARQVNALEMDGGGTVVVRDGVLVADAPRSHLSIALAGGGDAQVSIQDPVHVGSLSLTAPRGGLLQFLADGGLQIEQTARLSVVSSGCIHAFTPRIKTPLLRFNVFSEGNVVLKIENDSEEELDTIDVGKIKHRGIGNAVISIFGRGTARIHRALLVSGGKINAPDVLSEDVSLESYGETIMRAGVMSNAKTKIYGFGGALNSESNSSTTTLFPTAPQSSPDDSPCESTNADESPEDSPVVPKNLEPIERRAFPSEEQLVVSALYDSNATIIDGKRDDQMTMADKRHDSQGFLRYLSQI